MIVISQAKAMRHCHSCGGEILKGKSCVRYSTSGMWKNLCYNCVVKLTRELKEALGQ